MSILGVRGGRGRLKELPQPHRRQAMDAVSILSIYVVLLLVVPSGRGVGPLGGAGAPATIFGLGLLLWWTWHQIRRPRPQEVRKIQPVRVAFLLFAMTVLISYVVAASTSLPPTEQNSSNMALLNIGSYAGVVLVANDGISDAGRFVLLLRRISFAGGAYAVLGLVQFFSGHNIVDSVQIPGLAFYGSGGLDTRGDFIRSESTARHALEYAAVLSIILPIALTLAIRQSHRRPLFRWFPVAAILLASILSVTRSALVGMAVVLILLIPTWEPAVRKVAVWAGLVGAALLYAAVPGLGGTIRGMFSGNDPSIDSRTSSYSVIGAYVDVSPAFGRGLGTMGPRYRIFDNQYIGMLIEIGVAGTVAFGLLFLTAAGATFLRRRGPDHLLAALGQALCAAVLAGALLGAFFDSFHFPQAVGMLFLAIGLCGAHWNIHSMDGEKAAGTSALGVRQDSTGAQRLGGVLKRRWYAVLFVLLLFVPAGFSAKSGQGIYYAKFTMEFQAPAGATKNNSLRTEASSVVHYAALIQRLYEGDHPNARILPTAAPLHGTGLRDAVAVYLPNAGGQWQSNFNSPSISVEIVKESPRAVEQAAAEITAEITRLTLEPQRTMGVWQGSIISTERQPQAVGAQYVPVRAKFAFGATVLLAVSAALASALVLDRVAGWVAGIKKRREALEQ